VWQAYDESAGSPVAVKFLDSRMRPDPAAAWLSHANIVSTFRSGAEDGIPFVVMELVEGVSLATILDEGPMHPDDAMAVATQVCLALHAAHSAGVAHGHLEPRNIFIADEGVVKVGDFGFGGDTRDDMYAFGLLLQEMFGRRDEIVDRLLSREPDTAAEVYEILSGQPVPVPEPEADAEPERRPKVWLLATIAGVVMLAMIVGVCAWPLAPRSPSSHIQQARSDEPTQPVPEASPVVSAEAPPSTPDAVPAGTGVDAVRAVIQSQLGAHQITADAARALHVRLDDIARHLAGGRTKQANDKLAAMRSQLAALRRDNKVTSDGYDAILAAIDKLAAST